MTQAPWYVSNRHLHRDLQILTIIEFIKPIATKVFQQAANHSNTELQKLTTNYNPQDCRVLTRRPRTIELLNVD